MKNFLLLVSVLGTMHISRAQTGWNITEQDSLHNKINFIESTPDGKVYQVCYDYSQSSFYYKIICRDSSGAILSQISMPVSDSQVSIRDFSIDTVQQRLIISVQSSDALQYKMQLRITDYNLNSVDSAEWILLKSKADSCDFKGGGIDNAQNKFLVYRFRSISDQLWNRGICRKDITGSYTVNTIKAGQSPNDGYYIQTYAVTPSGNIFIGGSKRESLFGKMFYFEKVNSSLNLVFEIKDQLIPLNNEDNHVSSLHLYNNNSSSQVVVCGSMYGMAPGDTVTRCHGVIRTYNGSGTLRWNYQNYEVRDYKKVVSKNNFVHAVGTSNGLPVGFNTVISRLYLKDGVLHWQRYYGNRSTPVSLQIETDGSLLVIGSKQYLYPLQGGGTLKTQSYMLLRYSKVGKRLYDFNYTWNLPSNPLAFNAVFQDIATGRNSFYYTAGISSIDFNNGGGIQKTDSILLQQFSNGALRTESGNPITASIRIYPNPAKNEIVFESTAQLYDIRIFNVNGGQERTGKLFQNENKYQCDISLLKPGAYVLKAHTENGRLIGKFIKD